MHVGLQLIWFLNLQKTDLQRFSIRQLGVWRREVPAINYVDN